MTSVSKRKLEDFISSGKNTEASPASYSPKQFEKSAAYRNMKPPPFNSQESKWSPEKPAIKNNVPGPGAYKINGNYFSSLIYLNNYKFRYQ